MKKYLYLLVFLVLQFSIRAQDTVSPFTTFGYPVYGHDSMISFLGGVTVGGFGLPYIGFPDDCDGIINHYLNPNHPKEYAQAYRFIAKQLRVITGVALPLDMRSDTINGKVYNNHARIWGAYVTFDSGDYCHPTIHRSRNWIGIDSLPPYNYHIAIRNSKSECPTDTVINAYIFYFDTPIEVTDTFFIDRILEDMKVYEKFADIVIIADVRYPMEIDAIKNNYDAIIIDVVNEFSEYDLKPNEKKHASENALNSYDKFDYIIHNKTFEQLKNDAINIVKEVER